MIAIFAGRLAAQRPIVVHGDGQQSRDFVYVGDVVRYLLAAMALRPAQAAVFNVCTGRATSILELADAIARVGGGRPRTEHVPARAGDIRASLGDPGRLNAAFGFAAETRLAEGLARTLP